MAATARNYEQTNAPRNAPKSRYQVRSQLATNLRALPAFPNEALHFEPKFIDNSMVVRAEDPGSGKRCWRALGSVVAISAITAGLMLPSAYRMVAGRRTHELREEGKQLRNEIAELQATVAQYSGRKHLERYAKSQELVDLPTAQVQHITPKGSYAMNSLPSGK